MKVLMLIDIILRVILIVVALRFNITLDKLIQSQEKVKTTEFKRTHNAVSQSNFGSILNGRTNVYDKYKNKSGLYEPVQGKNGINLNDKGE